MNETRWINRYFIILWLVLFAVFFLAIYFSALQSFRFTATPEGSAAANQTATQINSARQSASVLGLFENNFLVSIYLVIPLIGLLPFMYICYNTGQTIGLLSGFVGISPLIYLIAIFFFPPVGLLEIGAYAVLAAEATYVGALALTHTGAQDRIKTQSWKSFILYIVLLLVAATVEMISIG